MTAQDKAARNGIIDIMGKSDLRWLEFAGRALLTGLKAELPLEQIETYVLEMFVQGRFEHDDVPMTMEDMWNDPDLWCETLGEDE